MLLSDDGQFIHTLTTPRRCIPKGYEVNTKHPVCDALPAGVTVAIGAMLLVAYTPFGYGFFGIAPVA